MMMPKPKTLAEAMAWLPKEVPKSEHNMKKVKTAAHLDARGRARRTDDLRPDGNAAGDPPPVTVARRPHVCAQSTGRGAAELQETPEYRLGLEKPTATPPMA